MWLIILWKVPKSQGFNFSPENTVLEKHRGSQINPRSLFTVKAIKECESKECETKECEFTPNLKSVIAHFLLKIAYYFFFVKFIALSYILMFV